MTFGTNLSRPVRCGARCLDRVWTAFGRDAEVLLPPSRLSERLKGKRAPQLPRPAEECRAALGPHAACEVAGAGNRATDPAKRARRGKPRIQPSGVPDGPPRQFPTLPSHVTFFLAAADQGLDLPRLQAPHRAYPERSQRKATYLFIPARRSSKASRGCGRRDVRRRSLE